MTGMLWSSAFVAGVFAIHPLHVEPEAWLSGRGEILAGLFFMLTLAAYLRYVRHPFSWRNYLLIIVPLILGLMSKQTVATLPVVLLLLDYWPLKRLRAFYQLKPLLWEKIPLFAISGLSGLAAFTAQQGMIERWGAPLPILVRIENSLVFYSYYLWKTIAPTDLTFYYTPEQFGYASWLICLSLALIFSASALSFLNREKRPYILIGWLWFVIMLLPLVGIVHVGSGAHPDRYDYLPMIGILISGTWFFSDSVTTLRLGREITACVAGGIILILASLSFKQVSYWADEESIWRRFQDCTPVADQGGYKKNGADLLEKGKISESIEQFRLAVANDPKNPDTIYLLAHILQLTGSDQEATKLYHDILIHSPSYARAHSNLGDILWRSGNKEAALKEFKEAVRINPSNPHFALRSAIALFENGDHKDAIELLQKTCILHPKDEGLKNTLNKMNALYGSKE
jgi:tetratricopeptide (TPR) repeat protein